MLEKGSKLGDGMALVYFGEYSLGLKSQPNLDVRVIGVRLQKSAGFRGLTNCVEILLKNMQ